MKKYNNWTLKNISREIKNNDKVEIFIIAHGTKYKSSWFDSLSVYTQQNVS